MGRNPADGDATGTGSAAARLGAAEWARLRARLVQELRRQVRVDPETLEDLAQEACVRLIRAVRSDPQLDPGAYIKVVAARTGADYLRRLYRHRRLHDDAESVDEEAALRPAAEPACGELLERLEWIVVELLDRAGEGDCRQLALAWFNGHNWRELAAAQAVEHAAIRKRWSRCLGRVRQLLEADPHWGPLLRWSLRP